MRKLLSLLVVGLAMISVARAAAVLADRQLVGFPKATANPPARTWQRLTVVDDQVILNLALGGWASDLRALNLRTLNLATVVPLNDVYLQLAKNEEVNRFGAVALYLSAVSERLVAFAAFSLNYSIPYPQFLILVDRQRLPKVLAVYSLGRIQDPRAGEGPSVVGR